MSGSLMAFHKGSSSSLVAIDTLFFGLGFSCSSFFSLCGVRGSSTTGVSSGTLYLGSQAGSSSSSSGFAMGSFVVVWLVLSTLSGLLAVFGVFGLPLTWWIVFVASVHEVDFFPF